MTNKTASTVVVGEGEHRHFRLPKLRLPKSTGPATRKYGRFLEVAVLIIVIAVFGFFVYKKAVDHNITIGKTVTTPAEIKELTDEVTTSTKDGQGSYGQPAKNVAQDDLILNAALKDQAAKHNIQVTSADIDLTLSSQYKVYGSKTAYERYTRLSGITNLAQITAENNTYEPKLENLVIAKKTLFVVNINYDAPYFNGSTDPAALRAQATKIMQTKFLPMFQHGLGEAQIAAAADLNYTRTNPEPNVSIFFDSMPVTAYYMAGCTTAQPCFNDVKGGTFASLPGIVSTQSKIDQLTRVGQYTDVFTSEAGFIGILQLSSQTPGAYNSWDALTKSYEKKYAPQFAFLELARPGVERSAL